MLDLISMGGPQIISISLIFSVFLILIPWWKIYEKSNQPGWSIFIPIYSTIIFLRIINKPWYWFILFYIPLINLIFLVWSTALLSKKFGKDLGFTIGLLLLPFIFLPILGYGSSKYESS